MTDREHLESVDRIAQNSTDRSTKIGAILFHPEFDYDQIVGWNHLTRGIPDDDRHNSRPEKYFFYEHAERSVLFTAANKGFRTADCHLYTTGIPCADCARGVVEAGISRVVVWKRGSGLEQTDRWYASITAGKEILESAGIEIVEVERG
jgi:dCMP deaminase